ncbi:MAG: M56 family metallopeptidase [Chlorobia bacterium]|nr:M56 family metallopeptidase [Fimbriimonadaceae bacterium]
MTRETLLLIALQSGALFLALWGIFRLVPSVPAGAKAWLWRLAFLKPLLSLLPFAVVTLRVLPAPEAVSSGMNETFESAPIAGPLHLEPVQFSSTALTVAPVETSGSLVDPLLIAWYMGVFAVACSSLWGMRRSLRLAHEACPVANLELVEALEELLEKARVARPVRLLSSSKVRSAMLVGGKNYAIVLPAEIVSHGSFVDLRMMLAHEVAHIARRDLMWFGLTTVVQSLFFFNPMVWVAARCSRLDHESATDRHAMILAGVPVRTYAEMLLRATVVTRQNLAPGSLPVAASYRTIHRRLQAMKHFNSKPTLWRRTAIAALALLTLSLLPAYELAAAAWPGGQFPEDMALDEPQVAVAQASAKTSAQVARAKTLPVANAQISAKTYGTVPLKVVKGKKGKARYYVWTKKGYVEVEAKDVQVSTVIGLSLGKVVGAKGTRLRATAAALEPIVAKSTRATTGVLNPIRAVAAPTSQIKTAATEPSMALIRTALEAQAIRASKGTTVATVPALLQAARTSVASREPLSTATVARSLDLARTNLTLSPAARELKVQGDRANLTNLLARDLDKSVSGPATRLTQGLVSTTIAQGLTGPLTARAGLISNLQERPRTATSLYSTALSKSLLAKPAQVAKDKRYQVVYVGANKLTIIDANGATKVYELEPGTVYELEGGTLRPVKTQKPSAEKKADSMVVRYYLDTAKYPRLKLDYDKSLQKYRYYFDSKVGNAFYRYAVEKDGKLKPVIVDKDKDKEEDKEE